MRRPFRAIENRDSPYGAKGRQCGCARNRTRSGQDSRGDKSAPGRESRRIPDDDRLRRKGRYGGGGL